MSNLITATPIRRMGAQLRLAITVAVLAPLLGFVSLESARPIQAHPMLVEMAASQPATVLSVIVRKSGQGVGVEEAATRMGAEVTASKDFINGFAANMTAGSAVALSRSAGVHWVTPDATMHSDTCVRCVNTSNLLDTSYARTIGADRLWNRPARIQGQGITVAVIDSGISDHRDFRSRVGRDGNTRLLESVRFNSTTGETED